MRLLYPEIKPYKEHSIIVDMPHRIYVEESGNPRGIPVLFLHGGPGAGCEPFHRRFFDPEKYRIILFDQRGCGRSVPHGSLKNNTTQDLINDIERIRKQLDVSQWVLFGGSWGSTLALLYAQACPDQVMGLILRGVFLCRQRDIDWFYQEGANRFFPDQWRALLQPLSETERNDILNGYSRLLNGDNELLRLSAAKAWALWEGQCATLRPNPNVIEHFNDTHTAISLAKLEVHYFLNKGFIEEDQILRNMEPLQSIPGIIVHGRYDMICPVEQAISLHQSWAASELKIIRDAGHSSMEAGIVNSLIAATDEMARKSENRA